MNTGATSTRSTRPTVPARGGSRSGQSTADSRTPIRGSRPPESQRFILRTMSDVLRAATAVSQLIVDEARPWFIEIIPWEEKRNKLQNRYLWGWLYKNIAMQLEAGGIVVTHPDGSEYPYTAELLHEIFKRQFLTYATVAVPDPDTGEMRDVPLCYSTAELLMRPKPGQEQRGFAYYTNSIKQFAIQLWGIHVPPTYNEDFRSLEQEILSGRYR